MIKSKLLLLPILFAVSTTIANAQVKKITLPGGNKYVLSFKDEFKSKKLNTKVWHFRTDSKHWSTQLPNNVSISDGMLRLNVKKENAGGKEYTGAGIISAKRYEFGYYESSFKVPAGAGWHNSFWLMGHDGSGGTGPSKSELELDICENDSKNKTSYSVIVHKWQGQHTTHGGKSVKTPDLSAGFHKWGCEYTEKEVKYYFDGELVQTIDVSKLPHGGLNIWLTTIASHHGPTTKVDDSFLPNVFLIDYVRYYKPVK